MTAEANSTPISLDNLLQAQQVFERFRTDMVDDRDQAGAAQAFEFCYELSWKMMKRVLKSRGLETATPKDTFRQAALAKLIDDPEMWFDFQLKRNLTTHTYKKENLDSIVESFDLFSSELHKLIQNIQATLQE
ncbi:MAG: HI0074 family nucleotidyltransferase substrate-binding subunit [Alphaproteobacteria bacterium]